MNRRHRRAAERATRKAHPSAAAQPDPRPASEAYRLAFAAYGEGSLEAALAYAIEAVRAEPEHAEALHLLAVIALRRGALEEAIDLAGRAVTAAPTFVGAHNTRGLLFERARRYEDALECLDRALALAPALAPAWHNRGNVLGRLGRHADAEASFLRALELAPDAPETHNDLGTSLQNAGRVDDAIRAYRRALELRPSFAEAMSNLGDALLALGHLDEAIAMQRRAVAANPMHAIAHSNLGHALESLAFTREPSALEEARGCFDRALEIEPGLSSAHWNLSHILLSQGDLARGWEEYEWRFSTPNRRFERVPLPAWDGGSLRGRTLFLQAEQGLGDQILFASCIPDVLALADRCIIECEPRLASLFSRSFPEATLRALGQDREGLLGPGGADLHLPLGSLPRHVRRTLSDFPRRAAYLKPDPERLGRMKARLDELGPGLRVGISWRSKRILSSEWMRRVHYSALDDWECILRTPGVHFVNLQYDDSTEECARVAERFGTRVTTIEGLDLLDDLDGVAALIGALDLVLAPGIAVANLAGALGTPVWMLGLDIGWPRLGTRGWPWYPSLELYSPALPGAWAPVLERVSHDLREFALRSRARFDGRGDVGYNRAGPAEAR